MAVSIICRNFAATIPPLAMTRIGNKYINIMGLYINKGNAAFKRVRNSEYVDKSGLIGVVNRTLCTEQMFSCVTRCRRFGKSMAANMLAAYYDHSCDSRPLFTDLQIAADPTFEQHLNKYPVISIDLSDFVTRFKNKDIVTLMDAELRKDIAAAYPDVPTEENDDLMALLIRISTATKRQFIFIIDEWDAILREFQQTENTELRAVARKIIDTYVDWLRRMFKGGNSALVFAGAYLTGILPIKKYKTESAMNNFLEYSMVKPGMMAPYFGFTKDEVYTLANKHGMDFDELEKWYDGYQIGNEQSIFNPNSVMMALREHWCESYWSRTGATEAVATYITSNFDGLKDNILQMLAGERSWVDPTSFRNDLSEVNNRDDVLTVLIHLGYLSYDRRERECYVPNLEVSEALRNAVRETGWTEVAKTLEQSDRLLRATLDCDADTVVRLVEDAHSEHTSILSYYNENSMACVLSIAYYSAHGDYIFHRELASGKGFADLVLLPRKNVSKPAIILELKCDKTAHTAIDQIRERCYPEKVKQYTGDLLLVGISYDKKAKQHSCLIERTKIEP